MENVTRPPGKERDARATVLARSAFFDDSTRKDAPLRVGSAAVQLNAEQLATLRREAKRRRKPARELLQGIVDHALAELENAAAWRSVGRKRKATR